MKLVLILLVIVLLYLKPLYARSNKPKIVIRKARNYGTVPSIYVATAIGGCPNLGATYISQGSVVASPSNCAAIGGRINSNNKAYCNLDWCITDRFIPDGLYISAPGSCGPSYRATGSFQVYGTGCAAMGGASTSSWGLCQMDFCLAAKLNVTVIYPTRISKCPNDRAAYGIIRSLKIECKNMGGAWNLQPEDYDWIDCHLDFCKAETVRDNPVVYFPFDTSYGLKWMSGRKTINAPASSLRIGKIGRAIGINGDRSEWVDLGNVSAACMTHPDACKYGGTITVWINTQVCYGILNSLKAGRTGSTLFCHDRHMNYVMLVEDGYFAVRKIYLPTGWFHMAMVYYVSYSQIKIYQNGTLIDNEAIEFYNYPTGPGSGEMTIGGPFPRYDFFFSSDMMIDDLKFWNRPLTELEIQEIYDV